MDNILFTNIIIHYEMTYNNKLYLHSTKNYYLMRVYVVICKKSHNLPLSITKYPTNLLFVSGMERSVFPETLYLIQSINAIKKCYESFLEV